MEQLIRITASEPPATSPGDPSGRRLEERASPARRGRPPEYFTIATADRWINPAAFAAPPAFAFGNVGRNTVVGPGMQTLDLAMTREFNITEKTKFQFRIEFFNAVPTEKSVSLSFQSLTNIQS